MKVILTSLILVASAVQAYALKPSYVVTTNNADRLGFTVTVNVDAGTGTVSRVTVGVKSNQSIAKHTATLVIRSDGKLVASIPLRHLAWRTDEQWITEFQLQSSLVKDASIILEVVLGTEPQYRINLSDWIKKSEQSLAPYRRSSRRRVNATFGELTRENQFW